MAQSQTVRLGIKGSLVRDSPEALCCALGQDTLFTSDNSKFFSIPLDFEIARLTCTILIN